MKEKLLKIINFYQTNKWTRFVLARNKWRKPCLLESKEACSFCLVGAIFKIFPDPSERSEIYDYIGNNLHLLDINLDVDITTPMWNDAQKNKKEVLKKLQELVDRL